MNLIPLPDACRETGGLFSIPPFLSVDTGVFSMQCTQAYRTRCGMTVSKDGKTWLRLVKTESLPREGYRLSVAEDGVTIEASTEAGVIWALTTLFEITENGNAPCVAIEDAPKYAHRGLLLDCARHFFSIAEVKRIIEQIARAKLNVLHWHLSDDQGWRVESKAFPRLNETGGAYYTQDEIRDAVAFAAVRGVEIVPEIDLPGHVTAILAAFPDLGCADKRMVVSDRVGVYRVILCAGKEAVFTFLDKLLCEICGLFPSPRFHIGGDEAPKREWRACPHCNKRLADEGLKTFEDLQGYFTLRVADLLKKYGKEPICWNDVLRTERLPQNATIQYWTNEHASRMPAFVKAGGKFIYSDMYDLYLDYPHSMLPLKTVYRTVPRMFGRNVSSASGLVGMEACLWSEHVVTNERLEEQIFPRVFALAEAAWSRRTNESDFLCRLANKTARLESEGIAFTPRESWNPRGRARRQDAFAYVTEMANVAPDAGESADPTDERDASSFFFLAQFALRFFPMTDLPALLRAYRASKAK